MSMKLKVVYPTELSEIPLRSYQEWYKVSNNSNDEELLATKFVEIFLGLKLEDAVRVERADINRMIDKISVALSKEPEFKQTFTFQGKEFGFIPNLDKITWGEYIDIESNLMDWSTMHIALSVLYRPITLKVKDTYEIMEYSADEAFHDLFKLIPLDIAMGASVFFYHLEKELLGNMIQYLKSPKKKKDIMSIVKGINLAKGGDGIIQYIDSLKETLEDLTRYQGYPCINLSPSLLTKSKKTKSSTTSISAE